MEKIVVGVSGIHAGDNPGPGIGVARSLKEDPALQVQIVGLAYDAMEPGIYIDGIVDKSFIMPYPTGPYEGYLERLLYIKKNFGLDEVIPNLDAELPLYIKYANELAAHGIRTFLPTMAQFRLRSKDRLEEIAQTIGSELPRTKVVHSLDAMAVAVEEIGLPVMVKGCLCKALRAHTTQEAIGHYHALVAEWGYPVIVQEIIAGEELNVVGLGDGEGRCWGLVGVKKMSTTALGKIWTGVTVKNEPMLAAAKRFAQEYRWRGPFELECILNGDRVSLIEINPRFPAWSYLATGVGINLPSRLLRLSRGLPIDCMDDYEAGKLFVRYTMERVISMDGFQQLVTRGETP